MKIVPSIIANSQKECEKRFAKIHSIADSIHIDIMDGKFVAKESMMFDWDLPLPKEVHLMVEDPIGWVKKNPDKGDLLIAHIETLDNPQEFIDLCRRLQKKVSFALNPDTDIKLIEPFFEKIDEVLVMTVQPGSYGGTFIKNALQKISHIPIPVEVDGSVNEQTIEMIKKTGVKKVVMGSYLQNAQNVIKAIKEVQS